MNRKKMLAWLLSLAMVLTMVPTFGVMAADEEQEGTLMSPADAQIAASFNEYQTGEYPAGDELADLHFLMVYDGNDEDNFAELTPEKPYLASNSLEPSASKPSALKGYIYYNNRTETLRFVNFKSSYGITYVNEGKGEKTPLTIELYGKSTLTYLDEENFSVYNTSSIVKKATGALNPSLTINSNFSPGFFAFSSVDFRGGNLNVTTKNNVAVGFIGPVKISDGSIKAVSGDSDEFGLVAFEYTQTGGDVYAEDKNSEAAGMLTYSAEIKGGSLEAQGGNAGITAVYQPYETDDFDAGVFISGGTVIAKANNSKSDNGLCCGILTNNSVVVSGGDVTAAGIDGAVLQNAYYYVYTTTDNETFITLKPGANAKPATVSTIGSGLSLMRVDANTSMRSTDNRVLDYELSAYDKYKWARIYPATIGDAVQNIASTTTKLTGFAAIIESIILLILQRIFLINL